MSKSFGHFLFIVVTTSFSITYADNYRFAGCEFSHTVCTPGNTETVKVITDVKSEFKRCPKTSHICMEKTSKISLADSRLHLYDFGALNVLKGGSIIITSNGVCRIFGRSFVEIEKAATTVINSGQLEVSKLGEIYNMGSLYVGDKSSLQVASHTHVLIARGWENLPVSSMRIDKSSNAEFEYYSTVHLSDGSELIASGYNKLEVNFQSSMNLQYADVFMANGSQFKIHKHSSLQVGDILCCKCSDPSDTEMQSKRRLCNDNANKTAFIFGVGSKLRLSDNSRIHLRSGQLVLDDYAELEVTDDGTIRVNGLLQIRDAYPGSFVTRFSFGKTLTVGERNENIVDGNDYCYTDSSLIITKGDKVLPKHLSVLQGAHCFTKPTGSYSKEFSDNARVTLRDDSDTNEFKCFKSRDELLEAVRHV